MENTYRVPTSMLWDNFGWREITAKDAEDAMAKVREKYGPTRYSLQSLQVKVGFDWRWATETLRNTGGIQAF